MNRPLIKNSILIGIPTIISAIGIIMTNDNLIKFKSLFITSKINKIIEFAKKEGYKKLVLDTWKDSTSARKLYENLGFIEIPMFDIATLKNSFCVEDEYKLKEIQKLLVFMEMVL